MTKRLLYVFEFVRGYRTFITFQVYGIKVYGSSWHPLPGYSFSRDRGEALLNQWKNIPADTDVLLTHTPPLGYLDLFKVLRYYISFQNNAYF